MRQTRLIAPGGRSSLTPDLATGLCGPLFALLLLVILATTARAADLYIYLTPSGDRVVTNRPVSLPGYVLEHSGLNARNAGQQLRDPDGLRGRAEIEQHINTAASQYQLDADLIRAVIRQESNFQINARWD